MQTWTLYNGAMQTTAAPVGLGGSGPKTMLQIAALQPLSIIEWGCSFNGSAAATPVTAELIETDVSGTVSAFALTDITITNNPGNALSFLGTMAVSGASTGYNASVEGSPAAVRNLDAPKYVPPSTLYEKQFPLGQRPLIQPNKYARIRFTGLPAGVSGFCYVVVGPGPD